MISLKSVAGLLVAGLSLCTLSAGARAELPRQPMLSAAVAMKMVNACAELATKNHWPMAIAVLDSGDNLKAYLRLDGALMGPADIARGKASTAVKMGWSSADTGDRAFDPKTGVPKGLAFVDGIILFPGGLPIVVDGTLVGGIGVSGSAPQNDAACAQAGLDAVKDDLK